MVSVKKFMPRMFAALANPVDVGPGHTQVTLTPVSRNSYDTASESDRTNAFDAKYIAIYGPAIIEATEEMFADGLYDYQTYEGIDGSDTKMPTMGADNGLTLAMMIGKEYDDPAWDDLLDQVTFDEMATLIGQGYHNTAVVPSVSKPATVDDNGPQGFTQNLTGVSECHTAYADENIMAATYNVDLMEELGKALGNDVLDLGASGLYGPAMNIHRNAYAGS